MTSDHPQFRTARVRSSGDTFGVDWSPYIDRTLMDTAALLERVGEPSWDLPAVEAGWTVREIAGLLLWRLGTPPVERVRAYSRGVITPGPQGQLERARASGAVDLPEALRGIVSSRTDTRRRGGLPALSVAVVGAFDIATALAEPLRLDPIATETVAAVRVLAAPVAVRSVLRRATLRAVDAGWEVGRGPVTASTAAAVILFLFGHTGPPEPQLTADAAGSPRP